jgi:Cytidylate kinase-like family
MSRYSPEVSNSIARIADNRLRRWAASLDVRERLAHERAADRPAPLMPPYIAISREEGAHGEDVARAVAEQMGWRLLDHNLLELVAERYDLPLEALEALDERPSSWMTETFSHWLDHEVVPQLEFITHLGQVVLDAARQSSIVVVGRAAQFFLPRASGLTIRIVAPLAQRIAAVQKARGIDRHEAARWLAHLDSERQAFVERYFHHNINDPHLYDCVINMEHFDAAEAAEIVVDRIRRHFPLNSDAGRTVEIAGAVLIRGTSVSTHT